MVNIRRSLWESEWIETPGTDERNGLPVCLIVMCLWWVDTVFPVEFIKTTDSEGKSKG